MHFAPRRHTGHAADIAIVKCDATPRQTLKVGRMNPIAAVWGQHPAVEGIEHHHDRFHLFLSLFAVEIAEQL